MSPQSQLLSNCPIFQLVYSYFLGEARTNIFPFLSYFGLEAQTPLAGGHGHKGGDLKTPVIVL